MVRAEGRRRARARSATAAQRGSGVPPRFSHQIIPYPRSAKPAPRKGSRKVAWGKLVPTSAAPGIRSQNTKITLPTPSARARASIIPPPDRKRVPHQRIFTCPPAPGPTSKRIRPASAQSPLTERPLRCKVRVMVESCTWNLPGRTCRAAGGER
jgi:hypothetical protein